MRQKLTLLIVVTLVFQGVLLVCSYAEEGVMPQEAAKEGIIPDAMDPATFEGFAEAQTQLIDMKNELNELLDSDELLDSVVLVAKDGAIPITGEGKDEIRADGRIDIDLTDGATEPITPIDNLEPPEPPEIGEEVYPVNPAPAPNFVEPVNEDSPYSPDVSNGADFGASFTVTIEQQAEGQEQTPAEEEVRSPLMQSVIRELEAWGLGTDWPSDGIGGTEGEDDDELSSLTSPFFPD